MRLSQMAILSVAQHAARVDACADLDGICDSVRWSTDFVVRSGDGFEGGGSIIAETACSACAWAPVWT